MRFLSVISVFIVSIIILCPSCRQKDVPVTFTEDEMKWLPYDSIHTLIFKDSLNNPDTISVVQNILNIKTMCEFPIVCAGKLYWPVDGNLTFDNQNAFEIQLNLHKDKPNDALSGMFYFNGTNININNHETQDSVFIENIRYDSVYVYNMDSVYGLRQFYYKPGVGFIKFKGVDNKDWSLKETI
jgi:hypothetical protein